MADVADLEEILKICDDYDLAMVEVGDIKIVFNGALGPQEEVDLSDRKAPDDEPSRDPYETLMGDRLPKFNNED